MAYGVVLFDDVLKKKTKSRARRPTEGWASIAGGPARRIGAVMELESDVRWLTNMDFVDFHANQLSKHPGLYYSDFLRTSITQIADDIGANVGQVSADKSAELLSTVFNRVMTMAESQLNVDLNARVTNRVLCDFISVRSQNKYRIPEEVNAALEHAFQTHTQCMTRPNRDWKYANLRRPRYQHAISVLSTAVPSEYQWVYINNEKMPVVGSQRIDWCVGHELPVLANVKVTPRRGDMGYLISYNSGANKERAWLSQPELLWVSMFCDVEVIGAFVCEAGFEPQKELDLFPELGDFSFSSYSLGLLAENLWVSMASPRVSTTAQKFYPPRAVWYRSIDRIEMFRSAVSLSKAGFNVSGYGVGSVWLTYPNGASKDLLEVANEVGLDVPVSKYFEQRNEIRLIKDEQ